MVSDPPPVWAVSLTRTKPKYPVKETLNMSINIAREAMGRGL